MLTFGRMPRCFRESYRAANVSALLSISLRPHEFPYAPLGFSAQ